MVFMRYDSPHAVYVTVGAKTRVNDCETTFTGKPPVSLNMTYEGTASNSDAAKR
jgi:hypothetical protein